MDVCTFMSVTVWLTWLNIGLPAKSAVPKLKCSLLMPLLASLWNTGVISCCKVDALAFWWRGRVPVNCVNWTESVFHQHSVAECHADNMMHISLALLPGLLENLRPSWSSRGGLELQASLLKDLHSWWPWGWVVGYWHLLWTIPSSVSAGYGSSSSGGGGYGGGYGGGGYGGGGYGRRWTVQADKHWG